MTISLKYEITVVTGRGLYEKTRYEICCKNERYSFRKYMIGSSETKMR